jgi:hypothetical protein
MTITNKDIDKLKEFFAIKEDHLKLSADVEILKGDVSTLKRDVKTLQGDVDVLSNMVRTGFDKVMKGLSDAREDRILASGKDRDRDRRIDGLERRMHKVEEKVGVG